MQHSPGPWKVGYRALDVMAESHVPGKGPMKVCDIRGWGYLTGKGHGALGLPPSEAAEIQRANAALIAASPDLLAAGKALLERYRIMGCGEGPEAYVMRRAIEKAELKMQET